MKDRTEKTATPRPPIIVVMGHIDHGKSTLLDYIRKTKVTATEAGGITQHVGAYEAVYNDKSGKSHRLTFLDTPGHEAFSGIRTRGAKAADIAILVVSAEDGVKTQTLEALKSLRESETPFVVAINKIDKPGANVELTKQNLAENEIYVEGYGGDIAWVAISALTGEGVPELLDMLVLMAEVEELKGDPSAPASGIVIETGVDSRKGISATLIIKNGTLHNGDFVVAKEALSPVRAMEDFSGKRVSELTFSSPVKIIGWNRIPAVGEEFVAMGSKKEAEGLAQKHIEANAAQKKPVQILDTESSVALPVLIKTDTAGSLEAIIKETAKIKVEGVRIHVIGASVGTVSENDVKVASASKNCEIIAFNVRTDTQARISAERLGIKIQTFEIIYKLTEWLLARALEIKPKIEAEESTGKAKVLKIFSSEKDRFVIGGRVEIGSIKNGAMLKILRRDAEIGRGKIRSLQQLKSKIEEAKKDTEFGAMIESKIEPAPGDRIESFITVTR